MSKCIDEVLLVCRQIYKETRARYVQLETQIHGQGHGFKILGGPPRVNPPIMFIGYQPGGSSENNDHERRLSIQEQWPELWPPVSDFATASWQLAARMRSLFKEDILAKSVSLNGIFLRFPNAKEYQRILDVETRRKWEAFCVASVGTLVDAMQPARIIVIGFSAADLFSRPRPMLVNPNGEVLAQRVQIGNRTAVALKHLTGARLSNNDLDLIRAFLAQTIDTAAEVRLKPQLRRTNFIEPSNGSVNPSESHRAGSYSVTNAKALIRRAANKDDPRWEFFDAMMNISRYEDYYAKFGDKKVYSPTYKSSPRTAYTEMQWARKQGWISDK